LREEITAWRKEYNEQVLKPTHVRVGKWVNNLGGIGTLLAAAVLVGMSAWSFGTHGTNLHP